MNVKIIIINGMATSGKSTFISDCIKADSNINCQELSTVDFVKKIATVCGWRGAKETKDRQFLHDLKIALEKWDDIPNKMTMNDIEEAVKNSQENDKLLFFVNIREPYNIRIFKDLCEAKKYECKTLLMIRPDHVDNEVQELVEMINDFDYDYVLYNNGNMESLQNKANNFVKLLYKEGNNNLN